jgi:N-acetylglucosaminyldiphosphoundecaprenol N-acetyl-beta-D-mannosaminyltransferase
MPAPSADRARIVVGGVPLDPFRMGQLVELLAAWGRSPQAKPRIAFDVYAACVNRAQDDPDYQQSLWQSDLNYPDGMGVVWALRALGVAASQVEKTTTTDLVHPLAECLAADHSPMFLLGGKIGVAEAAADALRRIHSGLAVVGTHHGYFVDSDSPEVVQRINESGATVLLVCMGVPREQRWAIANRAQLRVNLIMTGGGLLDFLSGRVQRGPRWMTDNGLEWLFRLATEPRRLSRRYLIGNPRFVRLVAAELLRRRRRS